MEESSSFVKATCQNYEVLVEDKHVGKAGGAGSSGRYDSRNNPKRSDGGPTGPWEKERGKFPSFGLSSEIEKTTNLQNVLEEGILDNRGELSLREVLGISKKEFHDLLSTS